jgi:hypothetical protein
MAWKLAVSTYVNFFVAANHFWHRTDIGLYSLSANRKSELASEYCLERFLRCGRWMAGYSLLKR